MPSYIEPRPGSFIIVTFGRFGTQLAIVDRYAGTGHVKVRKYRANSRTWTKNSSMVSPQFVLRYATMEEVRKAPLPSLPPGVGTYAAPGRQLDLRGTAPAGGSW